MFDLSHFPGRAVKCFVCICLGFSVAFAAANCTAFATRPDETAPAESKNRASFARGPVYTWPVRYLIRQHRELGTHLDGPRCPMYPSCAAYAERAIDEGGLVGMLLFLDRLFYREFGDLSARYFVAPRRLSRSPRFYDPLEDALPPPEREQNDGRPSFLREDFSRQVPR